MEGQSITVSLDGDIYNGRFEIVGHGDAQAVSVHYEGCSISANSGQLRPALVARTLLSELVRARQAQEARTDQTAKIASRPVHFRYGRNETGSQSRSI